MHGRRRLFDPNRDGLPIGEAARLSVIVTTTLLLASCTGNVAGPPSQGTSQPEATTISLSPAVVPAHRPPPKGVDPSSSCMQRAVFGDPAESEYILPYAPGSTYRLNQSYCFGQGGHSDELAYDFLMPIGTDVVVSRGGRVVDLFDANPDDESGHANYVIIQHVDGSAAIYAHLQQNSLVVAYGQSVATGDPLASSGFSGEALVPHLHFAVFGGWPDIQGSGIAVNFRNADGPHDFLGGLLMDGTFLALPPGETPASRPVQRPGDYSGGDFRGVDLEQAVLWGYDFSTAELTGARLTGADLRYASFESATLPGADLSHANLASAILRWAVLDRADLGGADLSLADLTEAEMMGADLRGAYLAGTDLTGTDLSTALLDGATMIGVTYDQSTRWPEGFVPPPQP